MAEHTPGPWNVGPTHLESEGKTWLTFSYQTHIVAPNGLTDLAIVEVGEDEGIANACLIAAAPDLLAALKSFGVLSCTPEWDEMRRRAIARAEGTS